MEEKGCEGVLLDADGLKDQQEEEEMPMPTFKSEPTAQVIVDGSGDAVYHVTHFRGARRDWECECAAFRTLGRGCKHIMLAKSAVRSKQKPDGVISVWKGLDFK